MSSTELLSSSRTDLFRARSEEALAASHRSGFSGAHEFVAYGNNEQVFYLRDRAALRAAHDPGMLCLRYVGRLVPETGLDDVLHAMQCCPVRAALAATLNISDQVRFLEPRDPNGVAELIFSLNVLVLMSRTTRTWKEQFGRVIMEAHARGVPVIGSSSGSIPEVVGSGGWIVPEGDAEALAVLLAELAAAPEQLLRAGDTGRRESARRFTNAAVSEALRRAWQRAAPLRREAMAGCRQP